MPLQRGTQTRGLIKGIPEWPMGVQYRTLTQLLIHRLSTSSRSVIYLDIPIPVDPYSCPGGALPASARPRSFIPRPSSFVVLPRPPADPLPMAQTASVFGFACSFSFLFDPCVRFFFFFVMSAATRPSNPVSVRGCALVWSAATFMKQSLES